MCGIAGVLRMDGGNVESNWVTAMAEKMIHRGPDGEGIWCDRGVGLAHRRLSIIDLETGDQPMANEDRSVWVTFNGEIYNFRELRGNLEAKGHVFKTASDTEVIVHGYEEWGKDVVSRLNGMFAFGLWSARDGRFLMARDRLGVKPLYYYMDDGFLIFASELRALMSCNLVPFEIDMDALELYLHYQYVPSPYSIYKGVRKLSPGEYMEIDLREGKRISESYWDIDTYHEPVDSNNVGHWLEMLEELLEDAVKIRLYSDVPFGAFLSGGTDSGLTVALMSKNLSQPVRTFSVGIEGSEDDELPYAAQIARTFNTAHEEFRVRPEGLELIPKICPHFGEPFADSSAVPTYYVSKTAASKVKMVLSGDGGDEIFGGYLTYHALLEARSFDFLPSSILKKAAWFSPGRGLARWFHFIGSSWIERHDMLMSHFSIEERKRLLGREANYSDGGYLAELYPSGWKDMILKAQYLDLKTYLPDDVLVKVDRMSMANSIEVRSPLLDYRIAEAAFSMPTSMKIPKPSRNGSQGKFILKELASRYLGKEYVYRPKSGFGIPIDEWLKDDQTGYLRDTLLLTSSPIYKYVDRAFVKEIVEEHLSGGRNHCDKIWNLLMLDGWFQFVYSDKVQKDA